MKKKFLNLIAVILTAGLLLTGGCAAGKRSVEKKVDNNAALAVTVPAVNQTQIKEAAALPVAKGQTQGKPIKSSLSQSVRTAAQPRRPTQTGKAKVTNGVSISAVGEGKTFFNLGNFPVQTGESVFVVSKRAAQKAGVKLNTEGISLTAYMIGIGGLQEFDRGPMSGWLFRVNGKYPTIGAGVYKIKPGDRIEWIYSTGAKKLN